MWWLIGIGIVIVVLLVFIAWVAVVTLTTVQNDLQDEGSGDFAEDLLESEWHAPHSSAPLHTPR